MTASGTDLFTRSEVQAGLPARRAQAALFLIESRTARLVAHAGLPLDPFLGETAAAERDLAFVEAFALGKAPPVKPSIQDLERYATAWRELVPDNPRIRAALAKLLGQKYEFTAEAVPGIRVALGLDDPAVVAAYERLYGQPLATIYAARPTLAERLRWAWAGLGRRLENLPPFWAVFALTLTETIGVSILALPIALAGIGPIPGAVLLAILGLVNVVTIIAMAEAVARNGGIRYGYGFLSRMVEDYLGQSGAGILWVGNLGWDVIGLLIFILGFATTLAAVTGVSGVIWPIALLAIALIFLRQDSLDATVTTALLVGAVNLVLLMLLSVLAFTRLQPDYLLHMNVPLRHGQPFDAAILALIFGTILGAYAAHPSVGISAKVVLPRDPSGHSLIWGVAAAQVVAIFFYCMWVLAINGAVAPQVLARETGTALIPLAEVVGPAASILGSVYVVLAMTIGTVYCAVRLFNLVRERLPRQSEPVVRLPRRQGRLVLQPRTGKAPAVVGLTYLGLARDEGARPRLRVDIQQDGTLQRMEIVPAGRWDDTALRSQWPQLDRRIKLDLAVQEATRDGVLLQVSTPLAVRYEGEWDVAGLHASDLLTLPDETRQLLTWLMRRGEATAAEIAAHSGQDAATTQLLLADLVEQGLLVERPATASEAATAGSATEGVAAAGSARYRPQLALRRGLTLPSELWERLDGETGPASRPESSTGRTDPATLEQPSWLARLGPRARFGLAVSPTIAVFLVTEVLLWTDSASFSSLLSFIGVVIASLLAGVFPVLLLAASRRKGDFVPATVYQAVGQPWLLVGIYLLFMASIFLHGLVIWQDPIQRASAVLAGLAMAGATWAMIRHDAFAGRVVVEVCQDLSSGLAPPSSAPCDGRFAISAFGKPIPATVHLGYGANDLALTASSGDLPDFGDLHRITFDLPAVAAHDLKVWAHRVTAAGLSESLPAVAEVRCGDALRSVDLRLTDGQAVFPMAGCACTVTLRLDAMEERNTLSVSRGAGR
jgi:amino acid permease